MALNEDPWGIKAWFKSLDPFEPFKKKVSCDPSPKEWEDTWHCWVSLSNHGSHIGVHVYSIQIKEGVTADGIFAALITEADRCAQTAWGCSTHTPTISFSFETWDRDNTQDKLQAIVDQWEAPFPWQAHTNNGTICWTRNASPCVPMDAAMVETVKQEMTDWVNRMIPPPKKLIRERERSGTPWCFTVHRHKNNTHWNATVEFTVMDFQKHMFRLTDATVSRLWIRPSEQDEELRTHFNACVKAQEGLKAMAA